MKRSRERVTISTTRVFSSGALVCSAMVNGHSVRMAYHNFTKREAIAAFRKHIHSLTQ